MLYNTLKSRIPLVKLIADECHVLVNGGEQEARGKVAGCDVRTRRIRVRVF